MNPQMQQYRPGAYPQAQARGAPAARRPGECDASTNVPSHLPDIVASGLSSHAYGYPSISARAQVSGPIGLIVPPTDRNLRQPSIDFPALPATLVGPNRYQNHIPRHLLQDHIQTQLRNRLSGDALSMLQWPRCPNKLPISYPDPRTQAYDALFAPTDSDPPLTYSSRQNLLRRAGPEGLPSLRGRIGPMPPNPAPYAHPSAAAAAAQHAHQIQSATAQQRHAIMEHQSAQRRARKPTDKNLPDGIDELLVSPSMATQYRELRDAERRLDYAMMRKRTDLQDTFNRTVKRQKMMRIWITNTTEHQPWQAGGLDENAFDFNSREDPCYRVKIEGRLLDDPEDDIFASDDEEQDEKDTKEKEEKKPAHKFTHFFKSLTVDFDRARQGATVDPSMQVEWKKQPNTTDFDELAFKRRGDENMNITINLFRDENPERFRLSHALAQTLDMEEADRAETVMGLWEYVKLFGLQEDEEKRSIRCDEALKGIFNRDQVFFPHIPELIMQHLHPLPPIKLDYTIRVDQAFVSNPEPTVYDVRVSVEDPIRAKVVAMMSNPEYINQLRQISRLDDELAVVIQAIHHSKAKHDFFKAMARDPIETVKKWLSSQRRDLEVILGEAARGGGEDGMGVEFAKGGEDGVWGSDLTREAVRYLLAKPQIAKT